MPADGLRCKGCAWDEGKQVEVCCAVAERGHLAAQAGGGGRGSAPNSGLQQQQAFSQSSCPRCTAGAQACFRNDCDALFTPRPLRERQRGWEVEGGRPKLIVVAGPERSGSTWLYNCGEAGWGHATTPALAARRAAATRTAVSAGRPPAASTWRKLHVACTACRDVAAKLAASPLTEFN